MRNTADGEQDETALRDVVERRTAKKVPARKVMLYSGTSSAEWCSCCALALAEIYNPPVNEQEMVEMTVCPEFYFTKLNDTRLT